MATLNPINNAELWNAVRAQYPQFGSRTAEKTLDWFNARTFEALMANEEGVDILNDFYKLSMRVYLQMIDSGSAVDTLEDSGFGESYADAYGAFSQRIAIQQVSSVSPAYRNLENYKSVDPYVIKKPEAEERFFQRNFDYQALITMQDQFQLKTMFVNDNGISQFVAGVMDRMEQEYRVQKYNGKLEVLGRGLLSEKYPLKDTQQVFMGWEDPGAPTDEELLNFMLGLANVIEAMAMAPQSSAYNAAGFMRHVDTNRLKLLIRPGIINTYRFKVLADTYNYDMRMFQSATITVPHFGGLIATSDGTEANEVFPVYDPLGSVIGYADTDGATTVTITTDEVVWFDPLADVVAVLADQGLVFTNTPNPYRVEPIRNPRGLYTNYWASSPDNGVNYDYYYDVVVFRTSEVPAA